MFFEAKTAYAQTFSKVAANPAVSSFVSKIMDAVVTPLLTGLFLLAGLIFIWGVFGLIAHGGDSAARETGQQHILWGVIGMFIMISAYGIIRLIGNTVGVGDPFQ